MPNTEIWAAEGTYRPTDPALGKWQTVGIFRNTSDWMKFFLDGEANRL